MMCSQESIKYINELLQKGNEIVLTDIANILPCNLDDAKSCLESLIKLNKKKIISFYIVNYVENGVFMCKKIKSQSLDKYPNTTPVLYSIKLSNVNKVENNDIFDNVLQKFASAKSSNSLFIPLFSNIKNPDISIRNLSIVGSDSRKNTVSGTSFDLKNNNKIDKSNKIKNENKPIITQPITKKSNIVDAFAKVPKQEVESNLKQKKLNISPVKPIKNENIVPKTEVNLFEHGDVEMEVVEEDVIKSPETKKFTINEKVPKQSTYVENGYFVMEEYEEIIKVEKEVKVKPSSNNLSINFDTVDKKRSQTSITSFFKTVNK